MQQVPFEMMSGLGSAAVASVGVATGNVVGVLAGPKLPVLDGSGLINLPDIPGSYRNKVITVTGNTTVSVTADFLWGANGLGGYNMMTLNSPSVNLAAAGGINQLMNGLTIAAATWYYVWGVCKPDGSGAGVVVTTSQNTPPSVLPTGYIGGFCAYMGALRTAAGSAQLMGTKQIGRKLRYIVGLAQTAASIAICSGAIGTPSVVSPVLVSTQVRGNGFFIPPHISLVYLSLWTSYKGGAGSSAQVATNSNFSGTNNGPTGTTGNMPIGMVSISVNMGDRAECMLESDNLFYAGQAGGAVFIEGWEEAD